MREPQPCSKCGEPTLYTEFSSEAGGWTPICIVHMNIAGQVGVLHVRLERIIDLVDKIDPKDREKYPRLIEEIERDRAMLAKLNAEREHWRKWPAEQSQQA